MKYISVLIGVMLIIASLPIFSQGFSSLYKPGNRLYVCANAGLSLRAKPDVNSAVLIVVKFGEKVEVLQDLSSKIPYTSSGVPGYWVKVGYQGKVGYQFDGFLSRYSPLVLDPNNGNMIDGPGPALSDWLKKQFQITVENTNKPEEYRVYDIIDFVNGTHFEEKSSSSYSIHISFPEAAFSYHEAFLLGRQAWPYLFNGGCAYENDGILCEGAAPMYLRIGSYDHKVTMDWYVSD